MTTARGVTLGVLICADVFDPDSYQDLARFAPQIIAIPTNSPFRPGDTVEAKGDRDQRYFLSGARTTGAHVLKACTVGRVFGRPVQGRSLIVGPGGIVARVEPEAENRPQILMADIFVS